MFASHAGPRLALFAALASVAGSAAAQSAGVPQPGVKQGFDPQPDAPGKAETPIHRLAASGIPIGPAGTDVTSRKGITIGQTFAAWGTPVTVPEDQAYTKERGRCAFRLSYDMLNQGAAATPVLFRNTFTVGQAVVSTNDSLSLNGLQATQLDGHAWLTPGTYDLILRLDAGGSVAETNEANNVMRVRLTLKGTCQSQRSAGVQPVPGDEKAQVPLGPPGHAGRGGRSVSEMGPLGYKGPDSNSSDASFIIYGRRALEQRLGAAASAIIINDKGGVLTLSGKVPTTQARFVAEQAVRRVPGVTDVQNHLVVEPTAR